MEEEVWKTVSWLTDDYQISSYGRVKSLQRERPTSRGNGIFIVKERILKLRLDSQGKYLQVCFHIGEKQRMFNVHRLVAIAFVSNPLGAKYVNHLDRNRLNNRDDNLEWCSQRENICHSRLRKGRLIGTSPAYKGRWRAGTKVGKKSIAIGTFDTEEEAHEAYKKELLKHGIFNKYIDAASV